MINADRPVVKSGSQFLCKHVLNFFWRVMLLDKKLLAPCGTFCGLCQYFEKKRMPYCSGCGNHKGNPFWGECKVYSCSTEHDVEHCGLCKDFPCSLFIGQFDPEHGQKNTIFRDYRYMMMTLLSISKECITCLANM